MVKDGSMKNNGTTTEVAPVQVGEQKTFKIEVYEKVYYTLEVSATSAQAAKRLVREINNGNACLSDFQPDSNGGSIPSRHSNVVIQGIEQVG